ncbi:protein TIFY 9 [Lolium perenne]|uniref:protein TIFY 9 n=1 Tax=Lolium perenne TaxID=4522 RepID=UPI0021EB2904|nr:protein TIFY 9-like [Lolium perenne]
MSSRAPPVELDFLGLRANAAGLAEHHGKTSAASSSSIRGMETSAIARIDPQLLRRVVVARPPVTAEEAPPAAPSPMTVFYNGSVAIFDVSHQKAEAIMRMAREVTTAKRGDLGNTTLVANSAKDIPLARTKSLHQFLAKRKERLTRMGPYQLGRPGTTSGSNSKSLRVKKEAEAA